MTDGIVPSVILAGGLRPYHLMNYNDRMTAREFQPGKGRSERRIKEAARVGLPAV